MSIFSNAEESFLLRALRSGLTDIAMDKAGFDWIADSKRLEGEGAARSLEAAEAIMAAQLRTSWPSLPLEAYAGTWRDPWYGDIEVHHTRPSPGPGPGVLEIRFTRTPALAGPLEPYAGDTMRTRFPDRREEDTFVTFELENGRPVRATMRAVSPDADFSYDFHDLRLVKVS